MAEKEATVYIVDVGKSMGTRNHGRDQTDLDWAMTYVWDKITTTMALDRKTTLQALIGLRTSGTSNNMSEEESYNNISVFQELSQILLPDLRRLQEQIIPSKTDNGDAISAIVIAILMITETCKKLKYNRKIVLVTNGRGELDADQIAEITSRIKELGITLVVLGVDFDDDEYDFKEENKPNDKSKNESLLKFLVEDCDGVFGTLAQAVNDLGQPRLKTTRLVPSYKGPLTLGEPGLESTLSIDVERYPRVMVRKPPTASLVFQPRKSGDRRPPSPVDDILDGNAGPSVVKSGLKGDKDSDKKPGRKYEVSDPDAEGGKRLVTVDELAKGYEYGRTAVHISELEFNITQFEDKAGLEIIGFFPADNYDRYMSLSTTNVIVGARSNSLAIMALSSLIHALYELEYVAVARLVTKENKPPVLLILAPRIEVDIECLVDVQLPFAEDVRPHKFAPLDRVETVSGKILKEHRNLPNRTLQSAVDNYVDAMDLTNFGQDEEGNPTEYMAMKDTYSPLLHRVDQGIRWRATHPTEPVPPPYEILTRFSKPPVDLVKSSEEQLKRLIGAADVKKVPQKVKGKRKGEPPTPRSGINVDLMLDSDEKSPRIDPWKAIPHFMRMLRKPKDSSTMPRAAAQMGSIVEQHISESFGDKRYIMTLEIMRVFRKEMTELEEPKLWNDWMKEFKGKLLGEKLGGDRRELWWEMRKERLGLIDNKTEGTSEVSEEEAAAFLAPK